MGLWLYPSNKLIEMGTETKVVPLLDLIGVLVFCPLFTGCCLVATLALAADEKKLKTYVKLPTSYFGFCYDV